MNIDTASVIYIDFAACPGAVGVIENAVRAVTRGVIDLKIQIELENFANQLAAQLQRNVINVRKEQLAIINAAYHAAKNAPILAAQAAEEDLGDLI